MLSLSFCLFDTVDKWLGQCSLPVTIPSWQLQKGCCFLACVGMHWRRRCPLLVRGKQVASQSQPSHDRSSLVRHRNASRADPNTRRYRHDRVRSAVPRWSQAVGCVVWLRSDDGQPHHQSCPRLQLPYCNSAIILLRFSCDMLRL